MSVVPSGPDVLVMPILSPNRQRLDLRQAWFDRTGYYGDKADEQRMLAVVARCLKDNPCPTPDEWIELVLVGAYTASLTSRYPLPPENEPGLWLSSDLQKQTWGYLLTTAEEYRAHNPEETMALFLRWFMPRYRSGDGPRELSGGGGYESLFAWHWRFWAANRMQSVHYLNPGHRKTGDQTWLSLPREFQEAADRIAQCVPRMLELVVPIVRRKFFW